MVPEEENDGLLDAERHQARHTIAPRAQLFPVAEKFVSVNGEGLAAGRPAAFIRFAGCNMWCTYCDTRWANHPLVEVEGWSVPDLAAWVAETGVSCVTLTGGEPLLQPYLPDLVQTLLAVDDPRPLRVEIETNGSRDLSPMAHLREACVEAGKSPPTSSITASTAPVCSCSCTRSSGPTRRAGSKDLEGTNHDQNQSSGAVLRRRRFHDAFGPGCEQVRSGKRVCAFHQLRAEACSRN